MMSWHVIGLYLGWLFAAFCTAFVAVFMYAMYAIIRNTKRIAREESEFKSLFKDKNNGRKVQ
jgi:hypothetical protein